MKIEAVVKRETVYILICCSIFSFIMNLVFFFMGEWSFSVLFGTALGLFASVFNFFLMALTVQKAVEKQDEKERRNLLKTSQTLRMLLLIVFAVLGATLDIFNIWAVLISLLFPRAAIFVRPLFIKENNE